MLSVTLITLQGAPINESDHCGDPPLLLAAGNGERRAVISACPPSQPAHRSLLLPVCCLPGHLTCCKLLLEEGADVEQRNVMGESPLIRAAHNGHLATVRFLVENGADVNAVDMVRKRTRRDTY